MKFVDGQPWMAIHPMNKEFTQYVRLGWSLAAGHAVLGRQNPDVMTERLKALADIATTQLITTNVVRWVEIGDD